jgi:hypothetical protein
MLGSVAARAMLTAGALPTIGSSEKKAVTMSVGDESAVSHRFVANPGLVGRGERAQTQVDFAA